MSNWRILDNTYIYDSTIEGFLSIVYESLKLKIIPREIFQEDNYIDNILETPVYIKTDNDKYNTMFNYLKKFSDQTLYNVYTSFLSGNINKEIIILKYIISVYKYGNKFNFMKNKKEFIDMNSLSSKVMKESHRMKGFLRFKEISNKVLYAEIVPENNILELLSKHFKDRLKNELWIIRDKKRNLCSIYNKKNYIIIDCSDINFDNIDNNKEELYQDLWKNYYKNITIKERKNLRCQMNFMPKKYWKYLIEMEDNYD